MFNFEFILTEVFISLSLLVLLLVASFVFKEYSLSTSKTSVRFNESYFATLSFILFLAFLVSVSSFNLYFDNSVFVFGGALKKNATITIFQSLILFFGSFITFTCRHFTINNSRFEFSILVGFVILGMLFLACSNDFISLYLAIEIQGLSAYILTSYLTFSAYSTEAGLKYFVLGSLSSGIMLFGFALIYAVTGSTCFSDIQTFLLFSSNSSVLTSMADQILFVGFLFSLVGLFFKIGSFPFQWYLPDVYEGAPVFSAAFFAVVTKAGVIAILATLLFDVLYVIQSKFTLFFIVSIAGSFITGILGAFFQQNIRRFFAYSSITHVSFFIISLLCFESGGVEVLVTYLVIYMFTSLAVLSLICVNSHSVRFGSGLTQVIGDSKVKFISQFQGLNTQHSTFAVILTFLLFSMAGIPPIAGFFAKMFVLLAAIANNLYAITLLAVVASCFSVFYYLRIVKVIFSEKKTESKNFLISDRNLIPYKVYSSVITKDVAFTLSFVFTGLTFFMFSFYQFFDILFTSIHLLYCVCD